MAAGVIIGRAVPPHSDKYGSICETCGASQFYKCILYGHESLLRDNTSLMRSAIMYLETPKEA